MIFAYLKRLAQRTNQLLIQRSGKLHTHRIHTDPLLDQIFHRIPVIEILIVNRLRINIRISRDPQQ